MGRKEQNTICWTCKNACGGCSWSQAMEHTPVPGWKAKPVKLRQNKGYADSYIVEECPQYDPEPARKRMPF